MAFNKVVKYYQGYVESVGLDHQGGVIAGLLGLALQGSYDLAGVCIDPSGNIYVTDAVKHIVLKITDGGVITLLAGSSGVSGNNGSNVVSCTDARFNYPTGITCDKNGDLYVCDTNNHQIRKISNNKVSLVAGASTPTAGTADGSGTTARFNKPHGIDIDYSGNLYVADTFNHAVRLIKGGVVSTFAGLKGTSGNSPVWADMITSEGILGTNVRFNSPYGITVNANGYVFVLDTDNYMIKRIDPAGRVRVFSGSGVFGRLNGASKTSKFQYLRFADINRSEELYVVDYSESGPSRVVRVDREGTTATALDFNGAAEGKYVASLVCSPSNQLIVVESEYMTQEFSSSSSTIIRSSSSTSSNSSSSSSYIENWSSSSRSSNSSSSSSYIENWSSSSRSSNSSSSSSYIENWSSSSRSSNSSSSSSYIENWSSSSRSSNSSSSTSSSSSYVKNWSSSSRSSNSSSSSSYIENWSSSSRSSNSSSSTSSSSSSSSS